MHALGAQSEHVHIWQWQVLTTHRSRKQQTPQPKAWQGPNPITQRASSSTPNGTEKPLPKLPPQSQGKTPGDSHADKHAHDRLLYIVAHFTVRLQHKVTAERLARHSFYDIACGSDAGWHICRNAWSGITDRMTGTRRDSDAQERRAVHGCLQRRLSRAGLQEPVRAEDGEAHTATEPPAGQRHRRDARRVCR